MNTATTGQSRWSKLGRGLDRLRRWIVNALFLAFLLFILLAWVASCQRITIPEGSALRINPVGTIVEEATYDAPISGLLRPNGSIRETSVGSLTRAIQTAASDDRISTIVLDLDNLAWISTTHAMTLGHVLATFKQSGKSVLAYGNGYTQNQYLLASFADSVYLHPEGQAILNGIGIYNLYFKELIDKLNINFNIFRAGTFKDFVEPFQRNNMSEPSREANRTLVDELWQELLGQMARNRKLPVTVLSDYAENFPRHLEKAEGHIARAALEAQLVDELLNHDQARMRIGDQVGFDQDGDFQAIDFHDYLSVAGTVAKATKPYISIIVAQGGIVMGRRERGVASAPDITGLIRQARMDDNNAALVLRIDSPGGSSFASELIRQELEIYQMTNRPLVVSMGNMAASGGYWIAATADHIVAEPTSLTGSIGVFGIFPTFERSLDALGVHSDGVSTTPLAASGHPLLGVNEQHQQILQRSVEYTYGQFIDLVARGRKMSSEAVDAVAQGRVWSGRQALGLGLVDQLGGLDVAVQKAMELAGLKRKSIKRLKSPLSPREMLMQELFGTQTRLPALAWLKKAQTTVASLGWLDDPSGRYLLCLSCAASTH